MKCTSVLQASKKYLEEVKTVVRIEQYKGTPHFFTGPNEKIKIEKRYLELPVWEKTINRQSLNKLILLGYAKYTDKSKNTAVYVDKDANDAEIKRLADVGKAIEFYFKNNKILLLEDTMLENFIKTNKNVEE